MRIAQSGGPKHEDFMGILWGFYGYDRSPRVPAYSGCQAYEWRYAVLDEQMAGQMVGRPGIGHLAAGLGERNPGQRRPSKIDLGG